MSFWKRISRKSRWSAVERLLRVISDKHRKGKNVMMPSFSKFSRLAILAQLALTLSARADKEVVNGVEWHFVIRNGSASVKNTEYVERGMISLKTKEVKTTILPAIPISTAGDIIMPAKLGGCPVTRIDSNAFYGCDKLTSVTIPATVTYVDLHAFPCVSLTDIVVESGNTKYSVHNKLLCDKSGRTLILCPRGLTSVTVPLSVTGICYRAFSGCGKLTTVTIPSSVTKIDTYAFSDNHSLTNIVVDSGNKNYSICNRLLCDKSGTTVIACPNGLTSVRIPRTVKSIGNNAFSRCRFLTSVTVPTSVTSIGKGAFSFCDTLTSVVVPASVKNIEEDLFYSCHELHSAIIPLSVTNIGIRAFAECTSLSSITIPASVRSIGWNAFSGCKALTSITIPTSVVSIGMLAFSGCEALTSLTIPSSVINIGTREFSGCKALTSVEFLGTPPHGVKGLLESLDARVSVKYDTKYKTQWRTVLNDRKNEIAEAKKHIKVRGVSVNRMPQTELTVEGTPFEIFPGLFLPNPKGYLRVLPGSSIDKKFKDSDQLASFAAEILTRYVRAENQDPTDDAIEVKCLKTMKDKTLSRKDFNKVVELMTIASKAVAEQASKCDNLNVVLLPITRKEDSCFSSSITDFNLSVAGRAVKGVSLVSQGWVLVSGRLLQVVRTKTCPTVADARRIAPSAENFLRSWIDLIGKPNANAGEDRLLPLKRADDPGWRDNSGKYTKEGEKSGIGAGDGLGERKLSNTALKNRKDRIRNLAAQEWAHNRRMRALICLFVALILGGMSILSFYIARRQKKKIMSAWTSRKSDSGTPTSYVPFRGFGNGIRQYVDFSGSMSRGDYWSFQFECYVIGTIIGLLFHNASIMGWLYGAFMLVPSMAATVRRFHDVGKSGFEYIGLLSIPVCTVFAGMFFAEYNITVLRPIGFVLVLLSLAAIVLLIVTLFRGTAVGNKEVMSNGKGAVVNVCCLCGGEMEDDTCLEVEFEIGESENDADGTYENVRVFCCRDCRNRAFEEGLDFDAVMQIDQVKQFVSGGAKIKKVSG